jgi:hypothetical protein
VDRGQLKVDSGLWTVNMDMDMVMVLDLKHGYICTVYEYHDSHTRD